MTTGIPAERLSDDDLRHELLQLKKKQDDIESDGTPAQQANHHSRTAQLEAEFIRRFGGREQASDAERATDDAGGNHPAGGDAPGHDDSGAAASGGAPSTDVLPEGRPAGSHRAE